MVIQHIRRLVSTQPPGDLMAPQAQQLLAALPVRPALQPLDAQGFAAAQELLAWPAKAAELVRLCLPVACICSAVQHDLSVLHTALHSASR